MKHEQILTVSQINRQVKELLELAIPELCIEGEISNLGKPISGHLYFTLKDEHSQLRCAYFRTKNFSMQHNIANGQKVRVYGNLSLYETRGDYQLIVSAVQEVGEGDLYSQFEALKLKLAASGLFNAERKRPIPKFPHTIGVITSLTAAALQDILTTLERRYPLAAVKIYASEVQGNTASQQLVNAITRANAHNICDVLILARGGGSIEDLWAFNSELLAHTIANSQIPIITGIGHETDFTIADFVADLRAPTPTAAAENATPNILELQAYLKNVENRLLAWAKYFSRYWQILDQLQMQLTRAIHQLLATKQLLLSALVNNLQIVNPLATLARGYALVTHDDKLLSDTTNIKLDDMLQIRLHKGQLGVKVIELMHS